MTDVQTAPAPEGATTQPRRRVNLGFDRFSGIYVWAVLVVIFSLWIPDLFLQWDNAKTILSFEAISTIVALGLIVPVAAGAFDLTIASTMTVASCFTAWSLLNHKGVVFACGGAFQLFADRITYTGRGAALAALLLLRFLNNLVGACQGVVYCHYTLCHAEPAKHLITFATLSK